MNRSLLSMLLLIVMMMTALFGCGLAAQEPAAEGDDPVGLPNPAAVNCEEVDGRSELRQDAAGNQYAVCIFADGSECEEWALFRGECEAGEFSISWAMAEDLVRGGSVAAVYQLHDMSVELSLKDGRSLNTIEPELDAIFQTIDDCGDPCRDMIIATE